MANTKFSQGPEGLPRPHVRPMLVREWVAVAAAAAAASQRPDGGLHLLHPSRHRSDPAKASSSNGYDFDDGEDWFVE